MYFWNPSLRRGRGGGADKQTDTDTQMNIETYRLNWARGLLVKKLYTVTDTVEEQLFLLTTGYVEGIAISGSALSNLKWLVQIMQFCCIKVL